MAESFSERLRRFRREKQLTQQELADALGVSNKTVSRWETEGGYPDVELLVPLARTLGVTVDALGGGALFFLLDLFMPLPVCYLAYLGSMAYGVYLQRYYTYQSRWFFGANLVMNAAVNLTLWSRAGTLVYGWFFLPSIGRVLAEDPALVFKGLLGRRWLLPAGAVLLLALGTTWATHRAVRAWSETGELPGASRVRDGLDAWRRGDARLRLRMEKPRWRQAVSAAIPLLACGYWFLSCTAPPLLPKIEEARPIFALLLLALAAAFTLPLLKKGFRRWIPLQWGMAALCRRMTGLLRYAYWLPRKQAYHPAWDGEISNNSVSIIGQASPGTVALALCLAAAWVVLGCARLRREERPKRGAAPEEHKNPG